MGMDADFISVVYGLDEVEELSPLYGGTANKNFLVKCKSGMYVLRRKNPKYSMPEWVCFEADFLRHLHSEGLPVPVPVKAADGSLWISCENDIYELFTFLEGLPFSGSISQIRSAGRLLGLYHNAAGKYDTKGKKQLERYDNPVRITAFLEQYISENRANILSCQLETLNRMLAHANSILGKMPDTVYSELQQTVIHGDYHPANLLYRDDCISGLFDFDWASLQPRVRDIADGVLFFACDRDKPIDSTDIYSLNQSCRFNQGKFEAFMDEYLAASGDCGITAAEAGLLPEFMKTRLLNCRVQGAPKVPDSAKPFILTNGILESLNWIDEMRSFLEETAAGRNG
jgi:Ser/Thr protein kinase RdoA (MazF antagonist)